MNIFYLDHDPKTCAQYHCDKHVVKMILESVQMISTVHWYYGLTVPYKPTHKNHPCVRWVLESGENYLWLSELIVSLHEEYQYRYGRHKIHKSFTVFKSLGNEILDLLPQVEFTTPVLAMPEKYKCNDPVKSYRDYYTQEKSHLFSWKNRKTPWWISCKYHNP